MHKRSKEHLLKNPRIKRQSEVVDLLLKLACEEFRVLQSDMFSGSGKWIYSEALSCATYILYKHFEIGMTEIHRILVSKGYRNERATLYNGIKNATRKIKLRDEFYHTYEYMLDEVLNFVDEEAEKEEDNWRYTLKGRVFTLLNRVGEVSSLKEIEDLIKIKLYEESKQETNEREEAYV